MTPVIRKARTVEKPWGKEQIFGETKDYVGKILHINPGHRLSLQFHRVKEETVMVLSGILTLEGQDQAVRLLPGDTYHVSPNTIHRFCNYGQEVLMLAEVSTNHLSDVVRLADDYTRK